MSSADHTGCEYCIDLQVANASLTRSVYELEKQKVELRTHITELRDEIYKLKKALEEEKEAGDTFVVLDKIENDSENCTIRH